MGAIPEITLKEFLDIATLSAMAHLKDISPFVPILIVGSSGIGKSQSMLELKKRLEKMTSKEWGFIDKRLSYYSTSEIVGAPEILEDSINKNKYLKYVKEGTFPGMRGDMPEQGILFLDEATSIGDKGVQSVTYQLLLDHALDDVKLPSNWLIIAAGNLPEDGGVYYHWPAPARNRVRAFKIKLSVSDWIEFFAVPQNIHPSVIEYIRLNPQAISSYEPDAEMEESMNNFIFATPRAWATVSNHIKTYEIVEKSNPKAMNLLKSEICATIGVAEGIQFFSNYEMAKNFPELDKIATTDWRNNEPVSPINKDITPFQQGYASYTARQKNINPIVKARIMFYLEWIHAPRMLIDSIRIGITPEELQKIIEYSKINNNQSILAKIAEDSTKIQSALDDIM